MTKITTKLSNNLESAFKTADEIWIAVALLNLKGFEFIVKSINKDCKINFIGGIDLPTDPLALTKLLALKPKQNVFAYMFIKKVFHPKVFIVKKGRNLKSFIGSANCTNGGLDDNVEMSIEIDDQIISKQLIQWFIKIQSKSQLLTTEFISDYKPKYDKRLLRRKEEKEEINEIKKNEKLRFEANLKSKNLLISKLKTIRKSKDYNVFKQERQDVIKKLKNALDYPNFINLDLLTFWRTKELGTIVPIRVKNSINNDRAKFTKLMNYICNDRIPLNIRIEEALNGELSIENVSEGFLSKVLVMHNPNKYYIHNKEFIENLKPFGLSFPRGLSFGDKYLLTRDTLKIIMEETNIENFAVLDRCLISM